MGENPAITSRDYLSLSIPKIESAEMMFSASRSRRLSIVAIIQSFAQLTKNYGKEGGEIITDNTQLTIFGGFAPNSESAQVLSKAMGSRTVMSGSVSRSKNDPSQSLQMIERALMTPDELKSLPKGTFIIMKTGVHPMQVKLKLFFKWGIKFDNEPYKVADKGNREVQYANVRQLAEAIDNAYGLSRNELPRGEAVRGEQNEHGENIDDSQKKAPEQNRESRNPECGSNIGSDAKQNVLTNLNRRSKDNV